MKNVIRLCITPISASITPYVLVLYQRGLGIRQRALDLGALEVIVPHINDFGTFITIALSEGSKVSSDLPRSLEGDDTKKVWV